MSSGSGRGGAPGGAGSPGAGVRGESWEGTFYGPKIDFRITDALGLSGSAAPASSTSSCERFKLTYTGADNAEHTSVMIHRALLGSMERFAGIPIETTAGGSRSARAGAGLILPVADQHNPRAAEVADELRARGFRVRTDERTESVGRKIRDAELSKAPYMLVVGDRRRTPERSPSAIDEGDLGAMSLDDLAARLEARLAGGLVDASALAHPFSSGGFGHFGVYTGAQCRAPKPRSAPKAPCARLPDPPSRPSA